MNPLIFESIDEPNLIKPPIVYIVGVLRQLGAPLKHNYMQSGDEQHAAADLPAAERRGLGGRHVVAEHEHGPGPLRPDRHARST